MVRWGVVAAIFLAGCSPSMFEDIGRAQAFTKDTVLPAIGDGKVEGLLSDYARKTADPEEQARWLRVFQQLGPLKSASDPACNVNSNMNTNADLSGTFATCVAEAVYANGNATVSVRLRKVGDGWQADAVNVNSEYFSKLMEKGIAPEAAAPAPAVAPATPALPTTTPAPANP